MDTAMGIKRILIPIVFVFAILSAARAAGGEYDFQTPLTHDGLNLVPNGISNGGTVVGSTDVQGEDAVQGFVLRDGSLTPVRIGGFSTVLTAINPSGTACVGWYYDDTTDQQRSFEYRIGDGGIRYLPEGDGPNPDTIAEDINDSGTIVGYIRPDGENSQRQGFIIDQEGGRLYDVPGALSTWLTGVNDLGQMVGAYGIGDSRSHPFLLEGDRTSPLEVPADLETMNFTDINNQGQVIGWGQTKPRGSGAVGFLLERDDYTLISYPGPSGYFTIFRGINDLGQIVGGTNDNTHGFIATPRNAIPEPSSLALLLAGAPLVALRRSGGRRTPV